MSNPWTDILTETELKARTASIAKLDPRFARDDAAFYESRSANQIRALITQAWNCNHSEGYQVARSYLKLKEIIP